MERISKYISYKEATTSQTAVRKKIANVPSQRELLAMKNVGTKVFDKVRTHFGKPLYVSSFFRSAALNAAVGGSKTSQHAKGEAIDIDGDPFGVSNKEIYEYIKDNLEFDQLIWEYGNDSEPAWVHVSLKLNGTNRKQVLRIG